MSQGMRALVFALVLTTLMASALTSQAQSRAGDTLSGTIHINLPGNDQDVWQQVAAAYMRLHPNVQVVVNLKPPQGYADYISAGFAAGTPPFDLVQINQNAAQINAGKFLDFGPYLNQPDPYIAGKPWRDAVDLGAMLASESPANKVYSLNLERVQAFWLYNKQIFRKVGITSVPTTWSQLLADCATLKKAGYIPLALGGDYATLWAGNTGWLFRVYADQYTRSLILDERSRPGDYTYDQTVDATWRYDPHNPYNDDTNKVTINPLRRLIAIKKSFSDTPAQARMDRWRDDSLPWRTVDQNLHNLLANYTPSGWYGINEDSVYALFLQQKAAIVLEGAAHLISFDKDLKNLTVTKTKHALQPFTLGVFNNPSMTGPFVQAPARTISVAIDFYGVPKKSFAQNRLNVDFVMWFTSPQGYGTYIKASVASPNDSLIGLPVVKNVALPANLRAGFAAVKKIGNMEKSGTSGVGARGFDDYPPSVRTWVSLMQQHLSNRISTAQFATAEEQTVQSNWENVLKFDGFRDSDLHTPWKQPPTRTP